MGSHVAILWDIQNVIPSKDNASIFVDGLFNYISPLGNISYSLAVGDWMGNVASNVPIVLSEKGFELQYIPQINDRGKKTKNSVDFILMTRATEMVFQYPHIDTFILLAGDVDYRPLLQLLKRHGKKVIIIYNPDTVSERLLEFADDYIDYRDLLPDESDENEELFDNPSELRKMSKQEAFDLLVEAITIMERDNKIATPGSIKVKMSMISDAFNGDIEGVNSWLDFLYDAAKNNRIRIRERNDTTQLLAYRGGEEQRQLPEIINILIDAIRAASPYNQWIPFTDVSNRMVDNDIRIKGYGYSKFKKLVLDAENRGLVETKSTGLKWYARLKEV